MDFRISSGQGPPAISVMDKIGVQLSVILSLLVCGISGLIVFNSSILSSAQRLQARRSSSHSFSKSVLSFETVSPGAFLRRDTTTARSCRVSGNVPIIAIAFGPQVENLTGSWFSPSTLTTKADALVCPLFRTPLSSSLSFFKKVSASSTSKVGEYFSIVLNTAAGEMLLAVNPLLANPCNTSNKVVIPHLLTGETIPSRGRMRNASGQYVRTTQAAIGSATPPGRITYFKSSFLMADSNLSPEILSLDGSTSETISLVPPVSSCFLNSLIN